MTSGEILKELIKIPNVNEYLKAIKAFIAVSPITPQSKISPIDPASIAAITSLPTMSHESSNALLSKKKVTESIKLFHNLMNIELSAATSYFLLMTNYLSRPLPPEFYLECSYIVLEEIQHFYLLSKPLEENGYFFGSLPCHNNIIKDIHKISTIEDHIALISLSHEAKGIDAGPRLRQKLSSEINYKSILEKILRDEEKHVSFGLKWYEYLCEQQGKDKAKEYKDFCNRLQIRIYEPNREARKRIGFDFFE